jgi:hypothetical protein
MPILYAAATARIDAPAARVYALLADYHAGHPRILPPKFFKEMRVEEGGTGAGTLIHLRMRGLGRERVMRMRVSEPEPGRVLAERDLDSDAVTTFRVKADGEGTRVTIAVEWTPAGGLAGLTERWMAPRLLRRVFTEELRLLAEVLRDHSE